ncbi:MAG: porin family protein [Candidatus Cyclobacteriaceae bacterium M3_2C_046]
MKNKNIIALFGLIFWYGATYAQLPVPLQKVICSAKLEVQGGANFSRLSAEDLSDSESNNLRPGFHLGLRAHTTLSDNLFFTPGVSFEQKGTNYEYSYNYEEEYPDGLGQANSIASVQAVSSLSASQANENSLTRKTSLSYLSFPLMLGFKPFKKVRQFSLITGLNPGFLLGSKTHINSFGNKSNESGTDNLRSFDLGVMLGASYLITERLGVNAFYDHGLINVNQQEFAPQTYNRSLKLMLFFRFDFNPIFLESYTGSRK